MLFGSVDDDFYLDGWVGVGSVGVAFAEGFDFVGEGDEDFGAIGEEEFRGRVAASGGHFGANPYESVRIWV